MFCQFFDCIAGCEFEVSRPMNGSAAGLSGFRLPTAADCALSCRSQWFTLTRSLWRGRRVELLSE